MNLFPNKTAEISAGESIVTVRRTFVDEPLRISLATSAKDIRQKLGIEIDTDLGYGILQAALLLGGGASYPSS